MAAPKPKPEMDRLVAPARGEDDTLETSLRPRNLSEFVGQQQARENLSVFIEAARGRAEALDHVLFSGPPGLGKTTLAQIVARELGVNFRSTSRPVLAKAGDLAALLTNLEARDVLFIDEIHRLNPAVEEILYPAMEDFQLDLIIGEGPAARSVKINLAPFTLVGATTRAGLLTNPLRDRFGIPVRLNFYSEAELEEIVNRGARVLGIGLTADGANEIARRARGTPRIAGRLLRRVRDFAAVAGAAAIDRGVADKALAALEVDGAGLDAMDRRYLSTIAVNYGGGPVGVETLAAALSEPRDAIEDIIEPYLIQCGLLQRTPRGRLITSHAFRHLGLAEPALDYLFQIAPRQRLCKYRSDGRIAGGAGNNGLHPYHHGLVLGVAPVPALGTFKSFDVGERARGWVFEPDDRRIGGLPCCLDVGGNLFCLLRRLRRLGAKARRMAAVFITRAFAAFV